MYVYTETKVRFYCTVWISFLMLRGSAIREVLLICLELIVTSK